MLYPGNPPTFDNIGLAVTVACNLTVGSTIHTVATSDADADPLTLSFNNAPPNHRFTLNPGTGKIIYTMLV